jgi:CDP-4-dehydro-6-deoxyglucose reductase, E3
VPIVTYLGRKHQVRDGQTVLDALLSGGEDITHACRAGACGACIVRATDGELPAEAQAGLRDSWRARGYFHSCQCRPRGDLSIEPLGEAVRVPAHVEERKALSPTVTRVWIKLETPLPAVAGQYVNVRRESVARSYSIAALPGCDLLELHVRRHAGGKLSPYLCDQARPGDRLTIQGPLGHCFYVPGRPADPLLLAGTSTGLSPLWGVLHDALAAEHSGEIHLFHAARDPRGLYLVDELRALAAQHANLRYRPSVLSDAASGFAGLEEGPLDEIIARHLPTTTGMRAFLCGGPEVVQLLKKKIFLSGTPLRDIAADAFLPTASASPTAAAP